MCPFLNSEGSHRSPVIQQFCILFLLSLSEKNCIFGTAALKNGVYCFEPIERVSVQTRHHRSVLRGC